MIIQRLRNRQGGFTLIELLIVVAIIGIIAAILIPNLIDAIQKAKQKRTVADARTMGGALMSWVTDQVSGAAAGRRQAAGTYSLGTPLTIVGYTTLRDTILRPTATFFYLQDVPQYDAWGNPYTVYINNGGTNPKALLTASRVVAIHSPGRDGTPIGPTTTYTVAPFIATDYNQDIVWGDGFMIRWPSGLANLITATP